MSRGMIAAVWAALLLGLLPAGLAQAEVTRTWVSGTGDDGNPCSRTSPCKTFATALTKTAAGGEIDCLDPGGFGSVVINKPVAIVCQAGTAGVLVSGTTGIIVNAGANDAVLLSGLDIQGSGTGLYGIQILQAQKVSVSNSLIRGFGTQGIGFAPTGVPGNGTPVQLVVDHVTIGDNAPGGSGPNGNAILVAPATSAAVAVVIKDCVISNNTGGVRVQGAAGGTSVVIRGTTISGNARAGVGAAGGGGTVRVLVDDSSVVQNTIGISAASGASVYLTRTAVTGNATGVAGNVLSYGDNQVDGNGTDGVPLAAAHK